MKPGSRSIAAVAARYQSRCKVAYHASVIAKQFRKNRAPLLAKGINAVREMTLLHAPFCLRFKRGLAAYIGGSPMPDVPATSTGYPNTWPRVPKPSPGTAPMMYSCSR